MILTTNILENGSMLMFLPHCVIFGNLSLWNLQRCRSPPVKDWNLVFTRLQPWCHTGGSRNWWIVQKSLCCGQCEDATSMKVIYEERTELIKHLGCSCWPQGQLMLPFLTSCTSIKVKRYLQRAFICPCDILKHLMHWCICVVYWMTRVSMLFSLYNFKITQITSIYSTIKPEVSRVAC